MAYWRINTDRNARTDLKTCDLWFKHKMAFAGDFEKNRGQHAVFFPKFTPGDGVFMHDSAAGIVGYGSVRESWNGNTYEGNKRLLYIKELCEYRIAVDWELDCRNRPLPINGRLPYMGTCCIVSPARWNIESVLRDLRQRSR